MWRKQAPRKAVYSWSDWHEVSGHIAVYWNAFSFTARSLFSSQCRDACACGYAHWAAVEREQIQIPWLQKCTSRNLMGAGVELGSTQVIGIFQEVSSVLRLFAPYLLNPPETGLFYPRGNNIWKDFAVGCNFFLKL